jgi:dihydroflavonol-4-reductase
MPALRQRLSLDSERKMSKSHRDETTPKDRAHEGATVFITGATGFIGSAVLHQLVKSGFIVNALVRRNSPRNHLPSHGVRFAEGDVRDRLSVAKAMAGARYVFHVAADYRLSTRKQGNIVSTNVLGTRIVMEEAMRAGVERVVYTSSVATLAMRADGGPANEAVLASEKELVGAYKRSKLAAEQLVLAMIAQQGLPAVIVNPSAPVGPRDVKPTPTGRLILEAAAGRIPAFVDTGLNLVHVDDVALGHLAALRRGAIGERYILGGQNVLLSELLRDIGRILGREGPRLRLPWYSVLPVACAAEALAHVTGREPLTTLAGVRMARRRMFFTSAKAERELGVRACPYIEALHDAAQWFRDAGYLNCEPRGAGLAKLSLSKGEPR